MPNILKLLRVLVIFPISNAISERGFKDMNTIKTKLKSRMDVDTTLDAKRNHGWQASVEGL